MDDGKHAALAGTLGVMAGAGDAGKQFEPGPFNSVQWR